MRNEANVLTAGTAVAGAFAFFLRWLQNINIIEDDTGLAVRGTAISAVIILVLIAAAAGMFLVIRALRKKFEPASEAAHVFAESFRGETAAAAVIAAILVLSGFLQVLQANINNWMQSDIGFHFVCGLMTIIAGVAVLVLFMNATREKQTTLCCTAIVILAVFGCVWLVIVYKEAASDPVLWRNAIAIFSVCMSLMSMYYIAGCFMGEWHPWRALYCCALGAFLCIMTLVDGHTSGDFLCYLGMAALQLLWVYKLTFSLRDPDAGSVPNFLHAN